MQSILYMNNRIDGFYTQCRNAGINTLKKLYTAFILKNLTLIQCSASDEYLGPVSDFLSSTCIFTSSFHNSHTPIELKS